MRAAVAFSAAGAGKTAYYALRWVSTRGKGAMFGGVRGDGGGVSMRVGVRGP